MKRIISFLVLFLITIGIVSPLSVKAEEVTGTDVYVYSAGKLTLLSREGVTLDIRKWTYNMADRYGTVRMYPAYCLNHGKRADSTNLVSIKEFTSNPKVWGIVTNGYLYRSNSALGVSTDEQAYSATQAALWAYAEGWDLSEITGDAATIAAMKTIYNAGMAKSSVTTPAVSVTPDSSTLAEDAIDSTYYSQTFTPKANVGVKSYTVKLGTNAPAGTIITDTTNSVKSTFSSTEKFKVLVPKTAIDGKSGNFKLDITAELQSNAVLFMTNSDPQYQNFAGGYDPYSFYDDTATVNYIAPDSPEPPTENPPTPSEPTPEPEPEPTPEPPTTTYLEIIKVEAGTEFPLSGATFRVTDNLGGIIGTFTTDSTGRIVVPITIAGSYSVDEITTPEGYLLDVNPHQDIAISLDSPAIVTFTNEREPELEIRKIDSDSGQTLPGAVLRIASNDSFESIDVTTDNTGTAHVTGLLPGNYTITEIAAPSGYILDDTHHDITLVAGETASITIGNKQKPGIVIKKFDEKTMQVLPGAEFSIAKKGGAIVYEGITDNSGIIRAEGLEAGWYTVTEIAAPDGYLIATATKDVYLEAGKTVEVKFDNRLRPALTIVKLDAATGSPLSGAKFRVWKTEDLTVSEYTTDSTGKIVIHNLDEAIYSVEEIVPPGGYLSADETHRDIELVWGEMKQLVFMNERKPALVINKYDEKTGERLPGAEFSVKKKDGSVVWEGMVDENGRAEIADLDTGWYTITEIAAPDGYLIATESKDVYLEAGRTTELKFDNRLRPALKIVKVDKITNEPLSGAKFRVWQAEDGTVSEYITDTNGEILIRNLDEAVYSIEEISAPDGYLLSDNTHVDIELVWGEVKTVIYENSKLPSLKITKVDDTTKSPLAGAVFNVTIKNGNNIGDFTTDSKGEIFFPKLQPGLYVITEVKAPDGYAITNAPQDINLLPDGVHQVDFRDKALSPLYIKKIDSATGLPLEGATYRVTKMNGEFVGDYTTDRNGFICIPRLDPGFYTATEIAVPEGYMLDETPKTVELILGEPAIIEFSDKPFGSLIIKKVDDQTGAALSDTDFTITKIDGAFVGEYTTDNAGSITINSIEPGFYVITETRAKEGYLLDNTPKTIEVKWGKVAEVTFRNRAKSGVQIIKIDADTKEPLKDAEFTVYKMSGEIVGTYTTDGNGIIILDGLMPGWYKAAESKAPDGYMLDDTPKDFEVTSDQFIKLIFENIHMSGLQIKKIDSTTGNAVEGVEFEIAEMDGTHIGRFTTDKSGLIFVPDLMPGYYTVTETRAADGYLIDTAPRNVEIREGENTTLIVENSPMAGLLIVKTDASTGKPLQGAVYDITTASGEWVTGFIADGNQPNTYANSYDTTNSLNGHITGSYTTDANGRIQINTLPAGEYFVTERIAPAGYILDTNVYSVTITPGKLATLNLVNIQKAGLRLKKIDCITEQPIYGVEFMVFDSMGNVVGVFRTDDQGLIDFTNILPAGIYTIRETKAAEGYYLDEMPRTISFTPGRTTEIVWKNTPQAGQIQITKLSGDDNEINGLPEGSPLEGAVFEVYDHKTGNLVDRFVSGSDGRAVSKSLPLGRYTVKEVEAPQWYMLSDDSIDIEIEFATQIIKREYLNYSANTGVSIRKTGNYEAMPGDNIKYDIKEVKNSSDVPLTSFFWRDVLPTNAVRLDKIVTGTYNQSLRYKITAKTNKGDTIIIADNLSTTKNNSIDCSAASLGLSSDEYITSFSLVFGNVKAGFCNVSTTQVYVNVLKTLPNGYEFANKADCGGKYAGEWIIGNSTWKTVIYAPGGVMPRTGY